MHRIDNATAVAVKPAADAPGPQPNAFFAQGATVVDGGWLNSLQDELSEVIETGAGLTLDKADDTQLLAAINAIIVANKPLFTTYAWVVADMTGPTIISGGNIASVASAAAGDLTINFTNALPANYAVSSVAQYLAAPTPDSVNCSVGISRRVSAPLLTGSARLSCTTNITGTMVSVDSPILTAVFIGT